MIVPMSERAFKERPGTTLGGSIGHEQVSVQSTAAIEDR
jgi:hypothetical protein